MRPVVEGCAQLPDLHNSRLSLADFALLNDALDVRNENERRGREKT
jgi:hypothetical protein